MICKPIHYAFFFLLCPLLVAQQTPPATGGSSDSQALPDNPQGTIRDRDGWNRMRSFSRGDKIAVTTVSGETYRCTVSVPSEAGLSCTYMRGFPAEQNFNFDRDEILEIRQRHPVRDLAITNGIVSTLFFVAGGRAEGGSFDVKVGGVYAMVAGLVTTMIAIPRVTNNPGHLVYRKPGARTEWSSWRDAPTGMPPFFLRARRF